MGLEDYDIKFEELFRLTARPGETYGDDWVNAARERITEEGTLVESESYDDDFPATEDTEIWLYRGVYIVLADPYNGGPFASLEEARDCAEIGAISPEEL